MDNELMPKYRFHSVLDVTPEDIRKMGARAIGLDIDNTIAPDGTFKFLKGVEHWLDTMRKAGIPVIIISNGTVFRVGPIAKKFGLPYVCVAAKPKPKGLLRAAAKLGVPIEKLAMLGDQIFSDIKAATRCGAIAVRIDPMPAKSLYPHYYAWKAKREEPIIKEFEKVDENTYIISGSMPIYDVNKLLNSKIPEGDYDTISGYLQEKMGRIPEDEENPIIETKEVTFKIEEYEDRRIIKIKACRNNTQEQTEE